jgi:hypothetical protein
MGLYDNYKVNLSNTVRPFAGSVVPELREMKKDMDTASYKTLDLNMSTQDLLATAPTLDMDKDAYNQVSSEALGKIDAISQSGELARSLPDAYAVAHQTARKLNSLAARQKTMEEYKGKLTTMTPDVQEYLIAETERQNGPAQFDARTQRANPIVPVMPAKQIKDDEMVRQAVISIVRDKSWSVSDSDMNSMTQNKETGSYTIKTSNGIREIPAKDLMKTVDDALANSKEWQASLEQDAKAESYGVHKNLSEEQAKQEIDNPTLGYAKRAQDIFLKGGVTAKQALEMAGSEKIKMDKISNLKTYASGAASRELSESRMTGTVEKDAASVAAAKSKEATYLVGLNLGITAASTTAQKTSAQLATTANQYQADIDNTNAELAVAINDSKLTGDAGINAQALAATLTGKLNGLAADKAIAESANAVILDQEARRLKGKSWSDLNTANKKVVLTNISKVIGDPKEAEKVTAALMSGQATRSKYNPSRPFEGPTLTVGNKKYDVETTTKIDEAFRTVSGDITDVLDAASAKKAAPDNSNTMSVPIIGTIKTALETQLPNLTLYDPSNTKNVTKDNLDIDWSKASVGNYIPKLNRVQIVTDKGVFLADVSNMSQLKAQIADDMLSTSSPQVRQVGLNLKLNNTEKYERAFKVGSTVIYKHPATGDDLLISGNNYGIKRTANNTYVFVNQKTGKAEEIIYSKTNPPKMNFQFAEIENMLNNMIPKN